MYTLMFDFDPRMPILIEYDSRTWLLVNIFPDVEAYTSRDN